MTIDRSPLDHIAIVLMEPKFPENIGAAARAAWNMGISRLIVVANEPPDPERMAMMATHKAAHLLTNMGFHQSLETALAPFSRVVATTARRGRQRIRERSPREVVSEILPLLPENEVAFLFGPEDRGLTNDDLKYCQLISAIPTADFSSLNLAQAVGIHCYELYHGVLCSQKGKAASPRLATTFELEGMYHHLEQTLLSIDFLRDKTHDYYMNNIRQFLGRRLLTSQDSSLIRGICRQFLRFQGAVLPGKDQKG
ncbi:MAG: RNA methyltransferase [Desulfobulbaceae bacterium]|jgi:tRNA/rRNA methyltransferase|nr:RNA methyltransferase [Desulfobulbaceae bacterium]